MLTVVGVFAIISTVAAEASFAQKKTGEQGVSTGGEFKPYKAAMGEKINAFMVEKIVGSKVRNMKGEDLGTIKDIVVDIDTGRILYAVMDFDGFLGIGGKLFPVPWQSLAPLPSEGIFFLDVSKAKLKDAPAYDKDRLPDMGDMHWGTKVAEFYNERKAFSYYYAVLFGGREFKRAGAGAAAKRKRDARRPNDVVGHGRAGFLHDHMKSMIQQMSGMMSMMSKMMEFGKMNAEHMKRMSEMMEEMSSMMHEAPAVLDMMDKRPDTAMKDMSEMTKTMSELMKKMGETMQWMQE